MFEHFDHTADLGLRVQSDSLELLLIDAARGLTAMVVETPERLHHEVSQTVEVDGSSDRLDELLFDWLNELLFLFETEWFLPAGVDLRLQPLDKFKLRLTSHLKGECLDPQTPRLRLEHEVKAITYHGLEVREDTAGQWHATVIVDI